MPKISSIPSRLIYSVDVPEVESFKSEFVYNYYLPDESIQDYSGGSNSISSLADKMNLSQNILNKPGNEIVGSLNSQNRISDLRKFPRYVKLSWIVNNKLFLTDIGTNFSSLSEYTKLSDNDITNIVKEDQFASSYYTSLECSNGTLVQEMSSVFDETKNLVFYGITDTNLRNNFPKSIKSVTDVFKESNDALHASMSAIAYQKDGLELRSKSQDLYLEKLKSTKFQSQINNNFLYDILIQASNLPHPNKNFLKSFIDFSKSVNKLSTNYKLTDAEYKTSIPFHTTYKFASGYQGSLKSSLDNESTFKIVGYVIDKVEVFEDGTINRFKPIIINGGQSNNCIDYNVRYGAVYFYSIRTIMDVTYNAIDNKNFEFTRVGSYLASKDSTVDVKTIENVAPPPPVGLMFVWDYDRFNQNTVIFDSENNRPFPNTGVRGSLMIAWSFPVNSQMDIKKFQLFRRKSINDPFELIKMFDFDDSISKFISLDSNVRQDLIVTSKDPILNFFDDDFYQNSEYIYSVASIDAHGLTSNYSEQFKVTFNKFTNKIETTLVSIAGAPKQYPNMYLEKDLFVDTIKTSNKNMMHVYLNPDCIKIKTGSDEVNVPENILLMKQTNKNDDSKYLLNTINTDVQKSKHVNIVISKKI